VVPIMTITGTLTVFRATIRDSHGPISTTITYGGLYKSPVIVTVTCPQLFATP